MPTTTVRQSQWPQRITIVAAIGLLIVSWFFAYIWLMALTEGVLVPWDTTTIRPPHGNWQRTVNDFFEAGIGAYLPLLTFLVVNAALFTWGARRAKRIAWLATAFALTNVGAFVLLLPLSLALQSFVHATPPSSGLMTGVTWATSPAHGRLLSLELRWSLRSSRAKR